MSSIPMTSTAITALKPADTSEARLPTVAPTGFPVSYEAAKQAIVECQSPIECRTMADKAAAMAVYARMRDDPDLLNRAVRLQAWADRRWGELDRELHPDRRQENLKQNQAPHRKAHVRPIGERSPDGTTEYQRKISHRLAAIPEAVFTRQVESDNPPSVRQLAEQGKRTVVLDPEFARTKSPWGAIECADTREACETLERFAKYCESSAPEGIGRAVNAAEAQEIRRLIPVIDRWLDQLSANLSAES
jgi:hypothetical protein